MTHFRLSRILKSGKRAGRKGRQEAAESTLTEEQVSELNVAFDCAPARKRLTAQDVAELNKLFGCCAGDGHTADLIEDP